MIIDSAPDGGVSSPQPSDERGIDVRVEVTVGRNPSERLDKLLVDRGLVQSRERARALILAGKVSVNGQRTDKVGCRVATDAEVQLERPDHMRMGMTTARKSGAWPSSPGAGRSTQGSSSPWKSR